MMPTRRALLPMLLSPILMLGGCNLLAYPAAIIPGPPTGPAYKGLAGQTVGVMVWTDPGTRMDFPNLNGDVATTFTDQLKAHEKDDALKAARYLKPSDIVAFQRANPQLDSVPIEQVVTRLGVSRVIYIEVQDFQTRSSQSIDLFRGSIEASMRILEIENGNVKTVFQDPNIRVNYPPKSPEGVQSGVNANTYTMYTKTIERFAYKTAERFYTHEEDDDENPSEDTR